jgi:hypothetical protein
MHEKALMIIRWKQRGQVWKVVVLLLPKASEACKDCLLCMPEINGYRRR